MSSPNIIRDIPQRHIVGHTHTHSHNHSHSHTLIHTHTHTHNHNQNWNGMEQSLNQDIEELSSTFERMMRPHKAKYAYPRPATPTPQRIPDSLTASGIVGHTMDMPSRMRAIKVFNVMLARLWRRRCAEVCDLHELVRKYQSKASTMRDDLFLRNKMICKEQRRCDRLEMELRQVKYAAELSSQGCVTIENALNVVRRKEAKLRRDLRAKTQECSNFAELLNVTKTEMFRELTKFRQCAQELAEQQRQNRILEIRNAELEDELLTLKDRFQSQHDDIVVAVHLKQEKIDEAYETLKGYEEELAELELKHNELLKENNGDAILQEIGKMERKIGMVRYVICFINTRRWRLLRASWPNFKCIAYEIVARFLDYILNSPLSMPTLPVTSVGIYLTVMLLIGALY
ncbi:uncharacterized protein [Drosophila virilis]|uniref:Uncharacterized protein, isoform A n=2 Tax=Drosophila virilis TaxID=7244 RepID=B4M7Q0_DROVI|nr:stress response protein NST1 [Drosophila virilis]EDW62817.1 uncharacterized protein Dvir_GJ16408, isoform A [Drosophila virilis]